MFFIKKVNSYINNKRPFKPCDYVKEERQHHDKQVINGHETLTVNSSPYAVEAYRHFGFVATDTEQLTNGIRYFPMVYPLNDAVNRAFSGATIIAGGTSSSKEEI